MKNVFALFLSVTFSISLLADVSNKEKDVLIKLYQKTNGSTWIAKLDFNTSVSTWHGVKIENDKVISN